MQCAAFTHFADSYELMLCMWREDAAERPDFPTVQARLSQLPNEDDGETAL